jgi:hypothetical protein
LSLGLLTGDGKDVRLQGQNRLEPRGSFHIPDGFPETTLLRVGHSLKSQGECVGLELEAPSNELDRFVDPRSVRWTMPWRAWRGWIRGGGRSSSCGFLEG